MIAEKMNSSKKRVINYIQEFGFIIGIDAISHQITMHSQNVTELFGIDDFEIFIGERLENHPEIFASIVESDIFVLINKLTRRDNETYFDKIIIKGELYHFSVFRSHNTIILEFEKFKKNLHRRISNKYDNFYIIETEKEIWDHLLNTLDNIIDYDRILVYKFMQNGSGKVIAEKTNGKLQKCLGLYYPESDIPYQTRSFYTKKRKRFVRNIDSIEVPLISYSDDDIDITFASSRGVAEQHAHNIRRSGAQSSFNVSIIVDDKLWGMVNCQNLEAKHIDLEDRVQAGVFTVLASNAYSSYKSKKELEYRINLDENAKKLKTEFLKYSNLFESLVENREHLRKLPHADGFAIVSDRGFMTQGKTPDEAMIERIVHWAKANIAGNTFISRSFLKDYGDQLKLDSTVGGIYICFFDKTENEILIWFREESKKIVNWVGNAIPSVINPLHSGEEVYPKLSFEIKEEEIKGYSKKWSWKDELAIEAIRTVILETSHKQNILIRSLNEKLQRVNEELDTFSYTISHDLGTPLTIIKLNAQMLLKNLKDISSSDKEKITTIIQEIDNTAVMMHDVLQLSRAKHSEIYLESLETYEVITKITEDAKLSYNTPHTFIEVLDCPSVMCDKTMLHQVFLNIINNAVKYSSQKVLPKIKIKGEESVDHIMYSISDNGIGIPEEEKAKMFKTFSRLENAKGFKGNGIGLSIVHRIMKRIGGSVNFESNGEGTTFYLTFPKP